MNKKILIFGGTGAIGFSIAKNLKDQGYNPIIIARNKEDLISKSKEINCSYEICDVLEIDQIKDEISKHLSAKIKLNYKHDSSLIGGLIIQIDSIMVDTSIKNKLQQLENRMIEA